MAKRGYRSYISASNIDKRTNYLVPAKELEKETSSDHDVIIHHMSIGDDINNIVKKLSCKKRIMIYHNITPPHFFQCYDDELVKLCRWGQSQLNEMKDFFDLAIAVSNYNARDLVKIGYKIVCTVPLIIDFTRFDSVNLDVRMALRFDDNNFNILFVGRGAPNKCQIDAILAFSRFRRFCPNSRFLLVGTWFGPYLSHAERIISALCLKDDVVLLNRVSDSEIKTLYMMSDLFLCMSEHEGFCVPLLECMYLGVPILAFSAAAVPDTLGESGVLFLEKDYSAIAAQMANLVQDSEIRSKVIESQKKRLQDFDSNSIEIKFLEVLSGLLEAR